MSDTKYNGWTNRNTYLFQLHFGDEIETLEDFEFHKNNLIKTHEQVSAFLGEKVHMFFSDTLDISGINWHELKAHVEQEIELQKSNKNITKGILN